MTISSVCGTQTNNTFSFSLRTQIFITLQSSSPMKSPKMKQHSWTQQSITESDSRMKAFLMCVHISNQLKPFSALTSTAVTHQALRKGLFKGEALTLLRTNSSRVTFTDNIKTFKTCLISRSYPKKLVEKILSEGNYADRKTHRTKSHVSVFLKHDGNMQLHVSVTFRSCGNVQIQVYVIPSRFRNGNAKKWYGSGVTAATET